jgi:hypothetical protein
MSGLRFEIPKKFTMDPLAWQTAYLTGIEGLPWYCKRSHAESICSIERSIDESSRLNVIWPSKHFGPILLSTTSLRSSQEPYDLSIELARGTLNRVRNQAFEWQRLGLRQNEDFLTSSAAALENFLDSITRARGAAAWTLAESSIEHSLKAGQLLCRSFSEQALNFRHQQEPQLATLLGVQLPFVAPENLSRFSVTETSNTVGIPLEPSLLRNRSGKMDFSIPDAQIQWARQQGLRICAGPLFTLQPSSLPEWLMLVDDPFEQLLQAACDHVREVVSRYRGKVHLWHVTAGLNAPNDLRLTDDQALRLAVHTLQAVRRIDDRAAVILSVDQPWCEYLGSNQEAVSPLHFVDALIRADLGLSGIGLEINHNYWPGGSLPRDLLEFNRLIDQWSLLGLPLMFLLRQPTDFGSDPIANSKTGIVSSWYPYAENAVAAPGAKPPAQKSKERSKVTTTEAKSPPAGPPNMYEIVELMLAKQAVQGIIWNQLTDTEPHSYPNSGMWNHRGERTSQVDWWIQLRKKHLV